MSGDTKRVLEVNQIDNLQGSTQRVKQETTLNNLRGITQRVYVVGGGSAPVIDELNVTPSTSAQTITAPEGTDGYSPVNVSAVTSAIDANIVAGNIKKDVEILGVTGSYEGQTPTGTMYIISNGTYNVADKAIANVQVPTTAPEIYRVFRVNNGKIENSRTTPFLTLPNTVKDIGDYCYSYAYYNTPASVLSGAVDLSSLTTLSGHYACQSMFQGCTGITSVNLSGLTTISGVGAYSNMFGGCNGLTSVDLSNLTTISGNNACLYMFEYCTGLTSVNLSNLTTINAGNACQYMFQGCSGLTSIDLYNLTTISSTNVCSAMFRDCTSLTSIDLSSLTTLDGQNACQYMFGGCNGLTSIDLSSLTTISGNNASGYMFQGCSGLTSIDLSSLTTVSGNSVCQYMFGGCTSLTTVYIGGTTAIDFGTRTNQFSNMFNACTQNIDVYAPAANQTQIESFSGYPNFSASGNVVWHWRS